MRLALFALLLVFVVAVLGQGFTTNPGKFQPRQNIDTFFLIPTPPEIQLLLLVTSSSTTYPNTQGYIYTSNASNDEDLIGGERDLQMTVQTSLTGRTVSTSINDGVWNIATPQGASGFVRLQLDGKDNSINLDTSGFSARDLTAGGTASAFNISLSTDIQTEFRFFVYNANGNVCTNTVDIPDGNQAIVNYYLPYEQFDGSCIFTAVTAIEVEVEAFNNVDATIGFFGTVGDPVSPSRTPTPTRSPVPSNTRTPTPTPTRSPIPSGTRTPTPTPTPSPTPSPAPSKDCMCHCPIFTCALIFDPDDDQNKVYYFDDDDENNGAQGGSLAGADSANTASSVTISVLAVIVAIVAFVY